MPDAMGAAGKQVGVERSRLIACIHTVEVERPDGSPKVDFAMLLLLRSEELVRSAHMGAQPTHRSVQDSHSPRSEYRTWSGAAPPILPLFLVHYLRETKG